jgi:hypothetical protein
MAALIAALPRRLKYSGAIALVVGAVSFVLLLVAARRWPSLSSATWLAAVPAVVILVLLMREYFQLVVRLFIALATLALVSIYVALRTAIVLLWAMRWICSAVVATLLVVYEFFVNWTPRHPASYAGIYLAEFGGILSFTAITIAILIWRQSAAEGRLLSSGSALRNDLIEAAYKYEEKHGEDQGSIAIKGLAEELNATLFHPPAFNEARYDQWLASAGRQGMIATLRPITIVATQQVKVPLRSMVLWRKTVWGALQFAVYAALSNLALAMIGDVAGTWFALLISALTVVVGLRATLRLVAD